LAKTKHHELATKHFKKVDPVMAKVMKTIGLVALPEVSKVDLYQTLCRSIAHQQLHGKAAETILNRFKMLFLPNEFPTPQQILEIGADKIRECGFSQAKVNSLRDIAEKTLVGVVPTLEEALKLSNEELILRLTEIRGVGRWTVEMLLMFHLGRLDVLPVDDFGVRNGYRIAYGKRKMPTPKQLRKWVQHWAPYYTLASIYMWRAADKHNAEKLGKKKKKKASSRKKKA
jgi:DNA-3-methyladenine glycosylase II